MSIPFFGKSKEQRQEEMMEQQRKDNFHQANLQHSGQQARQVEVLKELSEINDLPIDDDDPVLRQQVSTVLSTTDLEAKDIERYRWLREIILLLYLSSKPRPEGVYGAWRGMATGDPRDDIDPLQSKERKQIESYLTLVDMASHRSKGAKAMEETLRSISESVVNEDPGEEEGKIRGLF